ncbi:hypothetical protein MKK67_03365 [Methylobacterium sp. J-072]|uniref:hypothetical protein n=1 Tax=Methylobacterium sp. J-072 TaxID=2836651 RepID=UPI001FB86A34|nr:hypothetical protein [Methylobacterium sp. J-072]MCJ2091552.1 hypothetical protein [Methylobacterium sp. J-072]
MIENRMAGRARRATTRALCAVLLSGGAMLGLCRGASAQFAFEDDILPPRIIAWRLADRGFSGLSRPRFDGRVYVVDAVSPTGVPVRLFVDPAAGAIVGRQRIGAPETYARLERPGPGFGWTEEDAAPRRILRPATPDDVPGPAMRPQRRPAPEALRPGINPDGVNPDIRPRPEAPRKVARAAQPGRQPELKPALRTVPEAPAPKVAPAEAAKADPAAEPKPDTKSAAIDKTPAASPAPANPTPAKPATGGVAEAAKPAAQDWKDPPPDKKPVRIIGGATIVPGPSEKEPAAQ